uniref:Uncharacterized protein n=1 Tax=Anguilla anguilla TaxID=7936 RepID=A0A0E9UJL1_ANGAN
MAIKAYSMPRNILIWSCSTINMKSTWLIFRPQKAHRGDIDPVTI